MDNFLYRLFGGPPFRVMIRLVFVSILVGVFLALFDLTPLALWRSIEILLRHFLVFSWETVFEVGQYLVYGLMVVLPVWFVLRVLRLIA
jgi:Family of unknown function (DUF6460)